MLVRFVSENSSSDDSLWNTSFGEDAARQVYHDKKMISKDDRPAEQMRVSGIPDGIVNHIVVSEC